MPISKFSVYNDQKFALVKSLTLAYIYKLTLPITPHKIYYPKGESMDTVKRSVVEGDSWG